MNICKFLRGKVTSITSTLLHYPIKNMSKICLCQKKAVILQANDSVSDYVFDSKYISQSGCLGKRFLL